MSTKYYVAYYTGGPHVIPGDHCTSPAHLVGVVTLVSNMPLHWHINYSVIIKSTMQIL